MPVSSRSVLGARGAGGQLAARFLIRLAGIGAAAALCGGTAAAQSLQAPLGFPGIKSAGQTLHEHGVTFEGRYLGDFAANPAGGQRQGAAYAGEIAFGVRVDLGKLAGLQGGTFNILFTQRHGNGLAKLYVNNSLSVQQIYGVQETFQLTELTYEQKLFDDLVDIKLGRTELTNDFVHSGMYCQFENNAVCGQPFESVNDAAATFWPRASWGGRVELKPARHLYLKFGAYQAAPNIDTATSHGFTWGLAGTTGYTMPLELGVQSKPPHSAFANRIDAGVILDRSRVSQNFAPGVQYLGRNVPYLQVQGRLWQAAPGSKRGLYGFAVGLVGVPADRNTSNFEVNAGLVDVGPFPARPQDRLGVSISETHASAVQLAALYTKREAEGGTARPDANIVMFELNYRIHLSPWLRVTPSFQYVLNPDGNGGDLKYPVSNLPNAVVLGVQFTVDLPKLFGVPGKRT